MDKRHISVLLGFFLAASAMAQAYKWVDEDGVVHYSDRPREGAEEIELSQYSRRTGVRIYTPTARPSEPEAPPAEEAGEVRYENLSISAPAAEETLWNIEGVLNVTLALSPALQEGHRVRVYYDGTPRLVSGMSFQLDEVWRGVHNLQAEVIDETGRMLIRSKPNRFYVHQNTVRR